MSPVALGTFAVILMLGGVVAVIAFNKLKEIRAGEATERKAQAAQRERFTRSRPAADAEPQVAKRVKAADFGRR